MNPVQEQLWIVALDTREDTGRKEGMKKGGEAFTLKGAFYGYSQLRVGPLKRVQYVPRSAFCI